MSNSNNVGGFLNTETLQIPIQYVKYKVYHYLIEQIQESYPSLSLKFEFDSENIF